MFQSLLVPLDGSTFGEHALPLALSIARRAGAALNVVQVHQLLIPTYAEIVAPKAYEVELKVRAHQRAYLDGIVKRLTNISSVRLSSALLEGPLIAETLDGHSKSTGADLIVMATHGRGPFSRFWLGSVAGELVRRATVPLLLVHPHEAAPDFTSEPALRRIIIPLDGSTLAEQVIEPALDLGSLTQAEFTLVRIYGLVIDTGLDSASYAEAGMPEAPMEQLRAEAERYVNDVAEGMRRRGFTVQTHISLAQHPANAILDAAQSRGMDLIALETHGRRGLSRLVLGSVADKIIRGASMAVLVHRSPTE
jgi:nucleotide-binding universal stress UspA family protein